LTAKNKPDGFIHANMEHAKMVTPEKVEIFYNTFREISKIAHSSMEMDEVLELVVWKATEILNAKGALLRILDLDTDQLELYAAYGLSETYLSKGPITQKELIRDLYDKNTAIIIKDVLNDPRVKYPEEAAQEGIKVMVDLPLRFGDCIFGILRIFFETVKKFSKEEIQFLALLGEQCVCAIDKARFEAERNKYTQLALQTEKLSALGRMSAGIAHEINNPLAAILLYTSNLHKKASEDGPFKEGLNIIMRETKRCRDIIQGLLEFSRAKEPKKKMTNVNTIIERSIGILENEFRLRFIDIRKKLSEKIFDILLDENQIQQVFINLLLNAVQAIDKKGAITVESLIDPVNENIIIHCTDDGPGILPENLSVIFDPFFSTKTSGSGLGLGVSYGIIQNHQGSLIAQNLPEKGCRFSITLPILEEVLTSDV
jgi:two-component system NtrC family sensor kinase